MRFPLPLCVVAACGGSSPAAPGPSNPAPAAADPWDAVFAGGSYTLRSEDGAEVTVQAQGARRLAGAFDVVDLAWSPGGGPQTVVRGPEGVQLYFGEDDAAIEEELAARWWMPLTPAKGPDGLVVEAGEGDELCFTYGPEDDAPDCEDICFGTVCVTPGAGITRVDGQWSPDGNVYTAAR